MTGDAAPFRTPRLIRTFLIIGLFASPLIAGPDKPSAESSIEADEWYSVRLQDAKCGYMHSALERVGDEVHTTTRMVLEIARDAARVKISMNQSYRESLDGKPLAFNYTMTMGNIPVTYEGKIKDGKVTLLSEQSGAKRESVYDFDPEVRFAWGQLLEQRKRGLKPGTQFTVKTYEPSMKVDGALEMTIKVHGKESVDVLGKKQTLHRITSTLNMGTPIDTESWVDDDATPIVSVVNMGIMQVKMYRTTREEALEGGQAPEMFVNTFVKVARKVPTAARSATFRLRMAQDGKVRLPDIPNTSMQTFKRMTAYEGELTVRRIDWAALKKIKTASSIGDDLQQFTIASTTLNIDDRRIKRLARQATKSAKTPADKADALRKFVTDYVTDKSLDVGFATASEVARNRCGDCTEHGVLLAALARAAGMPARGVSGLVQVPSGPLGADDIKAFGFHMWAQVNIDGRWVDIDAAMRQTDCDPTHIALALMPLNDEGMMDSLMSILPLLGRLEIDVVDIQK